jgi:ATP-dependent helicase/nuclease subunit A
MSRIAFHTRNDPASPAITAQIAAAAPLRSSWVAANAGSGKTRVLTNRVARLLLSGTEPHKILCLTYTKAAAAEMQTRLFQTLGAWSMFEDHALAAALDELGETAGRHAARDLARARTLFARALETPGGLKIQTIHAFCEALLRRFPIEAGVAPQFAVLDDRQARALREEVLDRMAETDAEVVGAFAGQITGDDFDTVLREIGANRAAFRSPFDPARLAQRLGADPAASLQSITARAIGASDIADLRTLVPLLAASSAKDLGAGKAIAAALEGPTSERLAALEGVLLTKSGAQPFCAKAGKFPTRPVRAAHPDLAERLDDLMIRVGFARQARIARAAFERSAALHAFARVWLDALGARKARRGVLDFDDMIERTCDLLSNSATAAWVLWRLDGGLDHILVDEAQDTSPSQWQVVRAMSDEFFAGLGARDLTRTIFVVGDEKQSIYSFQGADPGAFSKMRTHFEQALAEVEHELQLCGLIHSFRSARPVLQLVDAVFQGPAGRGLENPVAHHPFDASRPGRVEIWPFLPKPDKADEPPWYEPVDARGPDDPTELLAGRIAERIATWLREGQVLPGPKPAPVRAGDVMILVQRRNALFHAIIRALKRHGVPVAGADVLRIGAELAVKDLLACLRVATTPADDLSLAALLRSPLGGISETDLFTLAHGRRSLLWRELRESAALVCAGPRAFVSDLLDQADFLRPFELLQRILIRHDGRRRLVGRLGPEAEDGIDALLDQALAYEATEPPTLTGFLDWMDRDEMQVKRRAEESADQVRVMTVHGAKGLESPIVILPDTVDRQEGRNAPDILTTADGLALWRGRADEAPDLLRQAEEARRARAHAENMRLLYVALTRAKAWLIVCGAGTEPKPDGKSWYALTRAAMETLDHENRPGPDDQDASETLVVTHNWIAGMPPSAGSARTPEPLLPRWAAHPAPGDAGLPASRTVLSPSRLGGAHAVAPVLSLDTREEGDVRARGDALHLLLERLHGLEPARRRAVARAIIPPEIADPDRLLGEAEAILDAPAFGFIFGSGALAEVEIAAPLSGSPQISLQGRIDRLVIEPGRVLAVDFKSNATVPAAAADIPEAILRQLGAYHAALSAIWTDRPIETAILWTRAPSLLSVPADLVRAAFHRARQSASI